MTRNRKARAPFAVPQAGSGRTRCKSRVPLLIGVLVVLSGPGHVARAIQVQPVRWEISPAGSVTTRASGVSRSEAQEYLERLGLTAGAVADPEVSVYGSDAFHGVQEAKADWVVHRLELNGKFASRGSTEVLGQGMTVTSVIGPDGLLITDDRGGYRIEARRKFPLATCDRGIDAVADCDEVVSFDMARDGRGRIVEFVRDSQGVPSGVRFGETLLLRYRFTPPLPEPPPEVWQGDPWREPSSWDLIDVRTSEMVIDSADAAKAASAVPVFSVVLKGIGEVVRFEGGRPFAVAQGSGLWTYALLSLETTSDVWRSVHAWGDMSRKYWFRVDYTDELVRVEIKAGGGDRSVVVEAPRSRDSVAPASFVHPGADMLTDAMRSGVRLRTTEPLETWLHSTFEKESLPIVLSPFHHRGIEVERSVETESGVVREAARMEPEFQFGPADGCEEQDQGIVCSGGESDVIGEESTYPW